MTAAGVIFLVMGILAILAGLLIAAAGTIGLVASGMIADFPVFTETLVDLATPLFMGVVIAGAIVVFIAILEILAGARILRLSPKGRSLGLRLAAIFGVLAVLGLFSAMGAGEAAVIAGQVLFVAIHGYLLWVLLRFKDAFRSI